jgi:hypothetical protein
MEKYFIRKLDIKLPLPPSPKRDDNSSKQSRVKIIIDNEVIMQRFQNMKTR